MTKGLKYMMKGAFLLLSTVILSAFGKEELLQIMMGIQSTEVPIASYNVPTRIACAQTCLMEYLCLAFDYCTLTHRCNMLAGNVGRKIGKDHIYGIIVKRTCQELKDIGISTNGQYLLDPGGLGETVLVVCNMNGKNGQAGTVVSHDSEARTLVRGYDSPKLYSRPIKYTMSKEQLLLLIQNSDNCEQFVRYECYDSALLDYHGVLIPVWQSRDGNDMYYWGGAEPGSGKCACGMTMSCADKNEKCNCDSNDEMWRYDEGYLRDKNTLPVSKLQFGDTWHNIEEGYHTLGKFVCYGKRN